MRGWGATKAAMALSLVSVTSGALAAGKVYIPPVVAMREMTPEEDNANRIWNLRAALNVAALQCQFSPFLMTVRNYNALIKNNAAEMSQAQATLIAHFTRYDGKKAGQNNFDMYSTKTYSSYSTLDAQLGFCNTAGEVGRAALLGKKGKFGEMAVKYLPVIRASLSPQDDPMTRVVYEWATVPPLEDPCLDKKGRPIPPKKCFAN